MASENNTIELAHSILNKQRRKMIGVFLSKGPRHISQIATDVGIDRATASYHLTALEDVGIVSSDYHILKPPQSKGRAARVFTIDRNRLRQAIEAADSLTDELKKGL